VVRTKEEKMNKTKIEWVKNPDGSQGFTLNSKTGCLNGCPYCYARKLANGRLRSRYLADDNTIMLFSDGSAPRKLKVTDPFYPRWWPERLEQIRERKKPAGIFLDDMSDWMGDYWPEKWTEQELQVMRDCPQHRIYTLTKQPQTLIKFSPFPDNCWVGVTITDRMQAHLASSCLPEIQTTVKFISFEPLLDDVMQALYCETLIRSANWLIIGSQTKPLKHSPFEWVEEIVNAADRAGVPVFIKPPLCDVVRYYRQEMPAC